MFSKGHQSLLGRDHSWDFRFLTSSEVCIISSSGVGILQNIIAGRSLPSIEEFLYICEYLNVTPKAFFDDSEAEPILIQKALDGMRGLPDKDLLMLIGLIDRFKEGKSE